MPDYTKKIDDLYDAYTFAKTHELNDKNVYRAHQLLSRHIVAKQQQGKYRIQNMYVSKPDGRIEYVAASPFEVESEIQKLCHDVQVLLQSPLSIEEVLFFICYIIS